MAPKPNELTSGQLAIVDYIATHVLDNLQSKLVIGSRVYQDFDPTDVCSARDTINVPVMPMLIGSDYMHPLAPIDACFATLWHDEVNFQVRSISEDVDRHICTATNALAECIEYRLINAAQDFMALGDANTGWNKSLISAAEAVLSLNDVPIIADAYLVVNYESKLSVPHNRYLLPAGTRITKLAHGLAKANWGIVFINDAYVVITRRLPAIPAGLGAVSRYIENKTFGIRLVASANGSDAGAMSITLDMLCGAATLRRRFGLRIKY